MAQPVITAESIEKVYGKRKVLSGISISVEKGEIFGFLGPNGAGKSTFLNILTGNTKYDSGEIRILDKSPEREGREIRSRINFVPQEPAFFYEFTVKKNLEFFASLYNLTEEEAEERINGIISWLKLSEFTEQKAKNLSGGFKTLLNIGCALVNNPDIIFLDEPTSGLDPGMRRLLWNKITALKKSGKTILITTHYMDEAEELCDRLALINKGVIVALGSPDDLIEKYGGARILVMNLETMMSKHHLSILKNAIKDSRIEVYGNTIVIYFGRKHSLEKISAITKWVVEEGYNIRASTIKEPELEDVFLSLVGEKIR